MTKHVKWYTGKTTYVDIDTGLELTKDQVKKHYQQIKTDKYYEFNYNKTIGIISHTIQCRRKPEQGQIF